MWVRQIFGSAITAGALTHNPLSLLTLPILSPKITAKRTIQNLGRLQKLPEKLGKFSETLLSPLAKLLRIGTTRPRLEGYITNDEEY